MKLYNAFIKKNQDGKIEDIILLEEGFSFWAFVFGGLWFLFHRMWLNGIFVFVMEFVLEHFAQIELISRLDMVFLHLGLLVVIGYNANFWFGQYLVEKKYEIACFVLSGNRPEAKIRAVEILHKQYPNHTIEEFSDIIVDSKSYQKMLRRQKERPYFAA